MNAFPQRFKLPSEQSLCGGVKIGIILHWWLVKNIIGLELSPAFVYRPPLSDAISLHNSFTTASGPSDTHTPNAKSQRILALRPKDFLDAAPAEQHWR